MENNADVRASNAEAQFKSSKPIPSRAGQDLKLLSVSDRKILEDYLSSSPYTNFIESSTAKNQIKD